MGQPCGLQSHGRYAPKTQYPFVYFSDINGWNGTAFEPGPRCMDHVVDYSRIGADITAGELPDYAFITPNLDHDMHDGTSRRRGAW